MADDPTHGGPWRGGCLCGEVRYEAEGVPFNEALCHCTDCRRAAGAPAVAWFTVLRRDFHVVAGTPKRFRSSERAVRHFCATCGTQLTFEGNALPDEIDVTTASLDHPDALPPRSHCYAQSRISWDRIDDSVPVRPQTVAD